MVTESELEVATLFKAALQERGHARDEGHDSVSRNFFCIAAGHQHISEPESMPPWFDCD